MVLYQPQKEIILFITVKIKLKEETMPTRIPIYRDDMFERMDRDLLELKTDIHDSALSVLSRILPILAKLESCVCESKEEVKKPLLKKKIK